MKTAISIITCPRPGGVDYLPRTAAALLAAGADGCVRRLVLADGDLPAGELPGWEIDVRYPRGGPRAMMWWAFERALAAGVDQLIYCEDDVTPVRNAVTFMSRLVVPDRVAFVDFYDFVLPENAAAGFHVRTFATVYSCNQCMLFPRRTLEWLVQQDPFAVQLTQMRGHVGFATDAVLGVLLARSPWPQYLAHLPRLVRHDGDVSAAHPQRALRIAHAFPGEDFDALSLLRARPT